MKYSVVFLSVFFSFISVYSVAAETLPEEQVDQRLSLTTTSLDFVQSKIEERDNQLFFSAVAQHQGPTRGQYFIGVEFSQRDKEFLRNVFVVRTSEPWIFQADEARPIEFVLPVPVFLDGEYQISIGAVDDSGKMIGRRIVTTKNFSVRSKVTIDNCSFNDQPLSGTLALTPETANDLEIQCVLRTNSETGSVKLQVKRTESAYMVVDELREEVVDFTQAADTTKVNLRLDKKLPIGAYQLELVVVDEAGVALGFPLRIPVTVAGVGGQILDVTYTASVEIGRPFPIAFSYELYGEGEYQAEVVLISMGEVCGEAQTIQVATNQNLATGEVAMDKMCDYPIALIRLLSKGVELDRIEKSISISTNENMMKTQKALADAGEVSFWERGKSFLWMLLPWSLLGVVILGLAWRRLRERSSLV
jgi:hypothetical protein